MNDQRDPRRPLFEADDDELGDAVPSRQGGDPGAVFSSAGDQVLKPITAWLAGFGTIGLVIAAVIDAGWNPPKSNRWDDVAISVVPLLLAAVGAYLKARQQRAKVTPTADPRNDYGEQLIPLSAAKRMEAAARLEGRPGPVRPGPLEERPPRRQRPR